MNGLLWSVRDCSLAVAANSQVHLAERAIGDDSVDSHAFMFLVVTHKVLDSGSNTSILQSLDVAGSKSATQVRVLRKAFKGPSSERGALDVDRRCKKADCISCLGLFG
jgi:hypothetical protein